MDIFGWLVQGREIMDEKTPRERLEETNQFFMENRIKRLLKVGKGNVSGMPQKVIDYYIESVHAYVYGYFRGSAFCAGVSLELAFQEKLSSKQDFIVLNDNAYTRGLISLDEKDTAHKIRLNRNKFVHGDYHEIAQLAYEMGIRVQSQLVRISSRDGLKGIDQPKIIGKPNNETDTITYAHFGTEKIAFRTITDVHKLLKKLYPTPEELVID